MEEFMFSKDFKSKHHHKPMSKDSEGFPWETHKGEKTKGELSLLLERNRGTLQFFCKVRMVVVEVSTMEDSQYGEASEWGGANYECWDPWWILHLSLNSTTALLSEILTRGHEIWIPCLNCENLTIIALPSGSPDKEIWNSEFPFWMVRIHEVGLVKCHFWHLEFLEFQLSKCWTTLKYLEFHMGDNIWRITNSHWQEFSDFFQRNRF